MKKSVLLTLFGIVVVVYSCTASEGLLVKQFEYNGKKMTYSIRFPKDFDASKTYPVLIGPSEVKGDNMESFYWNGVKDTRGWILVNYRIYNAIRRVEEVRALLNHLRATYKVEDNKFHTVCFSANSAGIFELVMRMPEEFRSITGMAGNPGSTNKEELKKLNGVKVQFVVGDKDTYWMNAAKKRHALLKEIGLDSQIEIIKNGPHVMKSLIGRGFLERVDKLRE